MKLVDNVVQEEYVPIKKDNYLIDLEKKIMKDKKIALNCYPKKYNNYTMGDIYKTFAFFNYVGLTLHEVPIHSEEKRFYDHPAEIKIILDYLNTQSILDIDYYNNQEYYKMIYLSINGERDAAISYIHEIVHTQASAFNNIIIKDDANEEVLPIFLEQVAAKTLNLDYYVYYRLRDLAYNIHTFGKGESKEDLFLDTKYIKSTLKALNLLSIYNNGNTNIKEEIMYYIQGIFDEYYSLEDVLHRYEITYSNSKKKLKKLKHI